MKQFMSKRKPSLYLQDILDSITKIQEYTEGLSFDVTRGLNILKWNLDVGYRKLRVVPLLVPA